MVLVQNLRLGVFVLSIVLVAQNASASCKEGSARLWAKVKASFLSPGPAYKLVFSGPEGLWNGRQAEFVLSNAKINTKTIKTVPESMGRTGARIVELEGGVRGVFKFDNPSSKLNNHRYEIAAYRIDKLLGLNVVPPTVERTVNGEVGSLQLLVENAEVARDLEKNGRYPTPNGKIYLLDYLIRNFDRENSVISNKGNYMIRKDGSQVAIDHGLSFRPIEDSRTQQLEEDTLFDSLSHFPDKATYKRFKEFTREELTRVLGGILPQEEIDLILVYRDRYVAFERAHPRFRQKSLEQR